VKKEKKLIIQLATKHNLPIHTIEEVIFSQFKFVAEIIKQPGFQTIKLPYFGKFHAKKERIAHMNEKTRRKLENKNKEIK
jgi:nucleoid DNA-binding protein